MIELSKKRKLHILAIATLFVFFLFFMYSSPLSKGNGWVDTNVMLEIGKAWSGGLVPYKDVFEQRGPLLFFYNLVANLISEKGYLGLFFIEVANLIGIYFVSFNIFKIFTQSNVKSSIFATAIPLLLISNRSFEMGGSPEEFIIFWVFLAIFSALKILDEHDISINSFLIGLSFSSIFWIKYTSIGSIFGILFSLLLFFIFKKNVKSFLKVILYFSLGFILFSLIWIIYFLLVKGFNDLINTYFLINMNAYAVDVTLKQRIINFLISIRSLLKEKPEIFGFYLASLVILFSKSKKIFVISISTVGFMILLTFIVGQVRNYSFLSILSVIILFVFVSLIYLFEKNRSIKIVYITALVAIPILFQFFVTSPFTRNVPYIWTNRPFAAKEFGEYISSKSESKKSFIYFNMIDGGVERFFNAKLPSHFFEQTNVPNEKLPEQGEMLLDKVVNKKVDYVIMHVNSIDSYQSDTSFAAITKVIPSEVTKNYKVVKYGYFYYPIEMMNNEYQLVLLEKK